MISKTVSIGQTPASLARSHDDASDFIGSQILARPTRMIASAGRRQTWCFAHFDVLGKRNNQGHLPCSAQCTNREATNGETGPVFPVSTGETERRN
jgi:hypothetical protein